MFKKIITNNNNDISDLNYQHINANKIEGIKKGNLSTSSGGVYIYLNRNPLLEKNKKKKEKDEEETVYYSEEDDQLTLENSENFVQDIESFNLENPENKTTPTKKPVPQYNFKDNSRYARLSQLSNLNYLHAGWKFQISLDDSDQKNIETAWDKVILPCLVKHKVNMSKIINNENKFSSGDDQDGKQVTIYAYRNPEKTPEEWEALFQEITEGFVAHNIMPGPRASLKIADNHYKEFNHINGSNFITYQYDANEDGKYTGNKNLVAKVKDIYAGLQVNVLKQPKPKERTIQTSSSSFSVVKKHNLYE